MSDTLPLLLPIVPSWHADAECACGYERDDTEEDA